MKISRRASLIFGIVITIIYFIGFFMMASELNKMGEIILYAGLALGGVYWVWSIIEVAAADDLKKYQKSFWLIIAVAVPFFGAFLFNIMHQNRNQMVA